MEYSEEQIEYIKENRPDFGFMIVPSLDSVVVEFLKKYEVYVTPPKGNRAIDGAITGAVTGLAGADVGGDMAMIQGQNKQTKLQEWTSWKQWALDHKEFPKFQTDFFNEVDEYNKNIDKKLEDPEVQKELDKLLTADAKRASFANTFGLIFVLFLLGGIVFIGTFESFKEEQNQSSYISF